jgi:hypothetical protein
VADFVKTISVGISLFGGSPASRWGTNSGITSVWNAFQWGEGTVDLETRTEKTIANTLSPTSDLASKNPIHVITETLTPGSETTFESLRDLAGYSYVFPDRVTDAEDRFFASWSTGAAGAGTWSTATASSTSWSEQ